MGWTPSRPRRAFGVNLGILAVTTAVCLGVLEAAARALVATGPSLLQLDPHVGKRFQPNFQGRVYVPEAGRAVDLRFNRDGLRGRDRPEVKPPGVRRVAVIGDSMIAAVATDEERTLVRRLEDRLNDAGVRWEVMNFGVSSSSTGNELVLYREVARRYRPDVVLCAFFVGNDLADNSHRLTRAPRIYFELDAQGELRRRPFSAADTRGSPLADWLDAHSRFYVWQKTALREMKGHFRSWRRQPESAHWVFSRRPPPDVQEAWRLTARLLQTFRREVEADGGRFVLVLIPSAEQVYDDLWRDLVAQAGEAGRDFDRDHPEEALRSLCAEAGIPLVTMTREFRARTPRASSAAEGEWLFHQGRWHLNDEGHQIAAAVVYRFLAAARR
jgi:hypothetical protein